VFSSLVSQQSQLQHSRGLTKITARINAQPLSPMSRRTTRPRVRRRPAEAETRQSQQTGRLRLASSACGDGLQGTDCQPPHSRSMGLELAKTRASTSSSRVLSAD
jgi:hypothetical protein